MRIVPSTVSIYHVRSAVCTMGRYRQPSQEVQVPVIQIPRVHQGRPAVTLWYTASLHLASSNYTVHHASEGQRMKLVGVNLLEKLLMTTAAPTKQYMSMIMRGLCHHFRSVSQQEVSDGRTGHPDLWHKPPMIIDMYHLAGAAVVIKSFSKRFTPTSFIL